jgi:hypothetical protein
MPPERLLFLPGAGGDVGLWEPVARGLSNAGPREFSLGRGLAGATRIQLVPYW